MFIFGRQIGISRAMRMIPLTARDAIDLSWATLAPNIRWIAWFGILSHPFFLVLNTLQSNGTEAPLLRFLSVVACVYVLSILSVKKKSNPTPQIVLSVAIVFFVLPFFFFWVLLQNALDLGTSEVQLASRQIQCAFSVIAIALLIYDARLLFFGTALCFFLAMIFSIGEIQPETFPLLVDGVLSQIPFWIFALVVGVYFNRNRVVVEKEKLKTLSSVGGHLAHELRTPLATIAIKMQGMLKQSEHLVASEPSLESATEVHKQLLVMRAVCSDIVLDTRYANSLIDMFLVRAGMNDMNGYEDSVFSVGDCVFEALDRYPFKGPQERSVVELQIVDDFEMTGPFLLFVHVLLNLLKNSFAQVQLGGSPVVQIRTEVLGGRGVLSVIDNGAGIAKENLDRVFSSFFTTSLSGEGAGVGLHFCKKVLQGSGGEITVTSQPHVRTVFTLNLPVKER